MSNIFDRLAGEPTTAAGTEFPEERPDEPAAGPGPATETAAATSPEIKAVAQELLKYGYLEESRTPELFRRAATCQHQLAAILEPLDLVLQIDTHRGVAFLAVAPDFDESSNANGVDDGSAWTHPLVRRQRLTLEQSLLTAILRQAFVMHEQESGVGESPAKVAVDELLPQYLTYFEDSGSDAKNESRLMSLLDQLKVYGIVSEVDKNQEVTIRPLIAHLANPESLAALLHTLRERTLAGEAGEQGDA